VTTPASLHRPRRRRTIGALAAVAGTVGLMGTSGCGIQSTGLHVVGSAPSLQANELTGDSGTGANQYELIFFRDDKLTPVLRSTNDPVTDQVVLEALIKGPSASEQAQGYSSVVPTSLQLVSNTADGEQWDYEYSMPLSNQEKAQIVCTLQADLNEKAVGTFYRKDQTWNECIDFADAYGAPAILPSVDSVESASPDSSAN